MISNIRKAEINDASVLFQAEKRISQIPGFLVSRPHEFSQTLFEDKIQKLSKMPNGLYVVIES